MPRFFVDENLPLLDPLWTGDDFVHQNKVADCKTDRQIWEYARNHNLTIISKDSDFSNRIQFNIPPPKVIHIRLGNMRRREMGIKLLELWPRIELLNRECKLINVYHDLIVGTK